MLTKVRVPRLARIIIAQCVDQKACHVQVDVGERRLVAVEDESKANISICVDNLLDSINKVILNQSIHDFEAMRIASIASQPQDQHRLTGTIGKILVARGNLVELAGKVAVLPVASYCYAIVEIYLSIIALTID